MRNYFYGWYFKCQSENQTLSIIPAVHRSGQKKSCSIQVITENHAWNVDYPAAAFHRTGKDIWIGKSRFGERGILLAVHTPKLDISGELRFGPLFPLKYDIMGPFSIFPFLECRHSVRSMWHLVYGRMKVNGQEYLFQNAVGYWEGDEGRSFPREYAWTQCSFPGGSLMLAVADVPAAGFHFRGVIGVVEAQRIPAGNLPGGKSGAGSRREASDCAGESGIRSQAVRKGQEPSESSG